MGINVNDIFGLKAVPGATQAELTARTTNVIREWHATRKPWVHIMSLASNCAGDGTTQFGVGFGPGGGAGYTANFERPQPVVESIDVKKQGELGTTRRVTIQMKAFTDDQLNTIAKCYFIPAMSVRIQYGWNVDAQGQKAPSPFTSVKTDPEAIALIQSNQNKYSSYDGLQGIVSNYGVSLDENVWNITLEVTGAGTSMASAKMSNSQNGCICEVNPEPRPDQTSTDPQKIKLSDIKALLIDIIDDVSNRNNIKYGGKSKQVYTYKYEGFDRDEYGREDTSGPWYTLGLGSGIGTQEATYISLGALQRILSCVSQNQRDGEPAAFEVNSDGVVIAKPGKVLCADPRIAYIPGGELSLSGGGAPSAISGNGVILDNILVNAIHCLKVLLQEEKGDDNLQKYLEIILKDINYNCGGPWEFDFINTSDAEPRLTKEKAPSRLTIVDTKKSEASTNPYVLKANSKNSCVRSVKMDMKLTDSMKTQALFSGDLAVAPPSFASDPCNGRFTAFTKISGQNLAKPPATAPSKPSCGNGSTKCSDSNEEPDFGDKFDKLKKGVTDDTVAAVRGELVSQMGKDKESNCKGSLIPIELSVVVDGIGGFSFGQTITCDRFPGEFGKYFTYQVTTVEHSITNDDWTTTINTVGRTR